MDKLIDASIRWAERIVANRRNRGRMGCERSEHRYSVVDSPGLAKVNECNALLTEVTGQPSAAPRDSPFCSRGRIEESTVRTALCSRPRTPILRGRR